MDNRKFHNRPREYQHQLEQARIAVEKMIEEQTAKYEALGYKVTRVQDELLVEKPNE